MTLWSSDLGLKTSRGQGDLETGRTEIRTGTHAEYFICALSEPVRVKRRNSPISLFCQQFTSSNLVVHGRAGQRIGGILQSKPRTMTIVVEKHNMIFELLIASIGLLLTTILMIAIILWMEQCWRRRETEVARTLPTSDTNRQPLEPSLWVWSPFAPSAPHFSLF